MTDSDLHDEVKPSNLTPDEGSSHYLQLQLVREARQWSIEHVAVQLKIRPSQVAAMEAGDWQNICPDPVFAQSYLRNYIGLLNLPVEQTLKEYGELNKQPSTIHSVNTVGSTLNVVSRQWHLHKAWRWVVVLVVVLVIVWQLFSQLDLSILSEIPHE
jgi:cytoskeletal protein RodZ